MSGGEEKSVGGDCLRVGSYCSGGFGGVDDFHCCSLGAVGEVLPTWNNGIITGLCQMGHLWECIFVKTESPICDRFPTINVEIRNQEDFG